jgi:signal transduction histidine kinase
VRLRLQSQLLIVMLAILSVLTVTSLLVVQQTVKKQVRLQTLEAVNASVRSFDHLQEQQLSTLRRTASMMAELPILKNAMTTDHPATIQDASAEFWTLSGSDLLVLVNRTSAVMALHSSAPELPRDSAIRLLQSLVDKNDIWFQDSSGLYRIVSRPITSGAGANRQVLGSLILGQRINDAVAAEIGRVADTDVVLSSGNLIIASTLRGIDSHELARHVGAKNDSGHSQPHEIQIGNRRYEEDSIIVQAGDNTVRCHMLLPLDRASAFVAELNRTIVLIAVFVAALGVILLRFVSSAITLPLERLHLAVKALAGGDSSYTLKEEGSLEVHELATAFTAMRRDLAEAQRRELDAERLAALGRAASSISHDLRHHLAGVVANAEFLHDADEMGFDKEEVYREIQRAATEMTQLIESLVEVSREQRTLSLSEQDLSDIVQHAIDSVRAHPEFRTLNIVPAVEGPTRALFDRQKLERAFFNLLLNACQAADPARPQVNVHIDATGQSFACRVSDNGAGIPAAVRDNLFEPFVSAGKQNGTGLGLTITKKIVEDHGGRIGVESTSAGGTVFLIRLPNSSNRNRSEVAGEKATPLPQK